MDDPVRKFPRHLRLGSNKLFHQLEDSLRRVKDHFILTKSSLSHWYRAVCIFCARQALPALVHLERIRNSHGQVSWYMHMYLIWKVREVPFCTVYTVTAKPTYTYVYFIFDFSLSRWIKFCGCSALTGVLRWPCTSVTADNPRRVSVNAEKAFKNKVPMTGNTNMSWMKCQLKAWNTNKGIIT